MLSWESRYVGNIRAINAGIFDAYLLKSLDGVAKSPDATGSAFLKCGPGGGKTCLFIKHEDTASSRKRPKFYSPVAGVDPENPETPMLHTGIYSMDDQWAVKIADELLNAGLAAYSKTEAEHSRMSVRISGAEVNRGGDKVPVLAVGVLSSKRRYLSVMASAMRENMTLVNLMVEFARRGGTPHPLMFDRVVRCLGWRHDLAMYGEDATPAMQYNNKYPVMTAEYEAANVPGMYFAGQLGHGKDHLKSAGGFIHGFRYTSRALFRILEAKYQEPPTATTLWHAQQTYEGVSDWNGTGLGLGHNGCNAGDWTLGDQCATPVVLTSPFERLLHRLFARINTASGPYQMVAVLADGIVFQCDEDGGNLRAEYMEDVPVEYFNARFDSLPRIMWNFGYTVQRQSLHDSRRHGTSFEVHLWYYPGSGNCASDVSGKPRMERDHSTSRPVSTQVNHSFILRFNVPRT